jgi:hypothetical protein
MQERCVREIRVGWGKADPVAQATSVDHPGDLRDAVEERLDPGGQY